MMSSQARKHRGYKTQSLVADYLKQNGYPYAESTGSGRAGSDITGTPYDIEVKARAGFPVAETMRQLEERQDDRLGFAVMRLNGQGEKSVGSFVAVMRFADLVRLLNNE